MNGYQQICLFMSQKKKKKREMNLLILELIECSSGHLHATPTLGPNYEFTLLFLEFFFPLCTIVPVVSAGAMVQTFQKQQERLGKVKNGGQTHSRPQSRGRLIYLGVPFILSRIYLLKYK